MKVRELIAVLVDANPESEIQIMSLTAPENKMAVAVDKLGLVSPVPGVLFLHTASAIAWINARRAEHGFAPDGRPILKVLR